MKIHHNLVSLAFSLIVWTVCYNTATYKSLEMPVLLEQSSEQKVTKATNDSSVEKVNIGQYLWS